MLLTVGELKARKGQDLVIKALPEIIKRHPDVLYVMVGYPSNRDGLLSMAKELGVADHVLAPGAVSDNEILHESIMIMLSKALVSCILKLVLVGNLQWRQMRGV